MQGDPMPQDQQMNALSHFEKQDDARRFHACRFQMSQMEIIIQQQSEQIRAQQLRSESMNMQMKKLMHSIRPLADPIVQTAAMVAPPPAQAKIAAPLSLHQPVIPSQRHQVPRNRFPFPVHESL